MYKPKNVSRFSRSEKFNEKECLLQCTFLENVGGALLVHTFPTLVLENPLSWTFKSRDNSRDLQEQSGGPVLLKILSTKPYDKEVFTCQSTLN